MAESSRFALPIHNSGSLRSARGVRLVFLDQVLRQKGSTTSGDFGRLEEREKEQLVLFINSVALSLYA